MAIITMFYADLHIHSRFSRGTSRAITLENLALWGAIKGLKVIGTGDFTHPEWWKEIREKLREAEEGLFKLKVPPVPEDEFEGKRLPPVEVLFMLTVEISTIYKKGKRTRKVHHLICVPDMTAAERFTEKLSRIGNIASDGRPILGLDSRHLLEILLECSEQAMLIPAHIWTPWFAVLGSRSGFDSIEECYEDLASYILAVETGLSSDPYMNWRVSSLDKFRLVSSSDAHSLDRLGREACIFNCPANYSSIREALKEGKGYVGTVEFFPEEGKYHLDGHRKCGMRLEPRESRRLGGICPKCGKPLTLGVMYRVEELADRAEPLPPKTAGEVHSLVPLAEILSEIYGTGPRTRTVQRVYSRLVREVGPELYILEKAPLQEIARASSPTVAEAISRLRKGKVIREGGYDGEYGLIRLFSDEELKKLRSGGLLFSFPESSRRAEEAGGQQEEPALALPLLIPPAKSHTLREMDSAPETGDPLDPLDTTQREAAECTQGPVLIIAGPGSGKTRTLTHRIAHIILRLNVKPQACLAVTFTRRAAEEMRERLAQLLGERGKDVAVHTFHSLGLSILREHAREADLQPDFKILSEWEKVGLLSKHLNISERKALQVLKKISFAKRTRQEPPDSDTKTIFETYSKLLSSINAVDTDDLIRLPVDLLEKFPELRKLWQSRFAYVSVDEYQDIDFLQYQLIKYMVPPGDNICVIGDPDQAIYSFRGADTSFFFRFQQDFPSAKIFRLERNYRSSSFITNTAKHVLNPAETITHEKEESIEPKVVIHAAPSASSEAFFVVKTIERLVGGSSFHAIDSQLSDGLAGGEFSFADFAVLYRTEAIAQEVEEAMRRAGIPFQKRSNEPLMARPEIHHVVDAVKNSNPSASLEDIVRSAVEEVAKSNHSHLTAESIFEILKPALIASGGDLQTFLTTLYLMTEDDTLDTRADRVSLLTLHSAKGLEWRVVFIIGCEEGILPLIWGGKAINLEEEKRLLYVGITRAKERVFLCHAKKRKWQGKSREMRISSLIRNLPSSLVSLSKDSPRKRLIKKENQQLNLF